MTLSNQIDESCVISLIKNPLALNGAFRRSGVVALRHGGRFEENLAQQCVGLRAAKVTRECMPIEQKNYGIDIHILQQRGQKEGQVDTCSPLARNDRRRGPQPLGCFREGRRRVYVRELIFLQQGPPYCPDLVIDGLTLLIEGNAGREDALVAIESGSAVIVKRAEIFLCLVYYFGDHRIARQYE